MDTRTDPFDLLAQRLVASARRQVRAVAGQHVRFRVADLTPLTFHQDGGGAVIRVDDDDVEVHRAVLDLADAADLAVGDVVDVRENADGYEVVGVVADA